MDEKKHVYKTNHNAFEITVKLKKPKSKDSWLKGIQINDGKELLEIGGGADNDRDEVDRDRKKKVDCRRKNNAEKEKEPAIRGLPTVVRTGSWADILSRSCRSRQEMVQEHKPNQALKRETQVDRFDTETKKKDEEIAQLRSTNKTQEQQITDLRTQFQKAQSELQEYNATIKELYDLANALKNENQQLVEVKKEVKNLRETLTKVTNENYKLERQLTEASTRHEEVLKPKDMELLKLKSIVSDVKTTLAHEINELCRSKINDKSYKHPFVIDEDSNSTKYMYLIDKNGHYKSACDDGDSSSSSLQSSLGSS